jgi:uncharacterized protein YbjT (DUF2867 family)
VTGPQALTFNQIADICSRVVEKSIRYVNLSDEQLKAGLMASGQSEWQATALLELNTYARQGHASMVTDTVQRITGKPGRTLAQWFKDHAAAFQT